MKRETLLPMLLAALQLIKLECDTAHWQATGLPAYADHLLYERLSEAVAGHIDPLAERIVGLHTNSHVDLTSQLRWMTRLNEAVVKNGPRILTLNQLLGNMLKELLAELTSSDEMTAGLEDLLASISVTQEENAYLLKQRFQGQPQ